MNLEEHYSDTLQKRVKYFCLDACYITQPLNMYYLLKEKQRLMTWAKMMNSLSEERQTPETSQQAEGRNVQTS